MKTAKKVLSVIMALAMVITMFSGVGITVFAAGQTHYLAFATDRHSTTNAISNTMTNPVTTPPPFCRRFRVCSPELLPIRWI